MIIQKEESLDKIFADDEVFNKLYPLQIQKKAAKQWTPLDVARSVAEFLAPNNDAHVLDIGSGVGKFCIAAAHYKPDNVFYGVEQRKDLVDHSINCSTSLDIYNVSFIHGNFTELDLRQFNGFYFYNSFYENIVLADKIDDNIQYSSALFNYYNRYLYNQLEQMPTGTRIATFHSWEDEMPPCYYVVKTGFDKLLKFWIKV